MILRVSSVLSAALLMGFVAAAVPATAADKDPVDVRQAAMKQLSAHMKGIGGFLKGGKGAGTAEDVALRGQAIAAIADKLPDMFPKGTSVGDLGLAKSGAKPEIWQRWDDFKAASNTLKSSAMAFTAAAESGDMDKIKAAMGEIGKAGCGGCHRSFREKRS